MSKHSDKDMIIAGMTGAAVMAIIIVGGFVLDEVRTKPENMVVLKDPENGTVASEDLMEQLKGTQLYAMLSQAMDSKYYRLSGTENVFNFEDNSITNVSFTYGVDTENGRSYSKVTDNISGVDELEYSPEFENAEMYIASIIQSVVMQRNVKTNDGIRVATPKTTSMTEGTNENGDVWVEFSSKLGYVKITYSVEESAYFIKAEEGNSFTDSRNWYSFVIAESSEREFNEQYSKVVAIVESSTSESE